MGKVLTIGREYGSNGRLIAQNLAQHLGIKFYDRELIGMAAKKSKIDDEELKEVDESRANPWFYSSADFAVGTAFPSVAPVNDILFQAESETIKDIAEKEDCIIVGRCSNYILRNKSDVRHIFVYAPLEKRIATVQERDALSEKKAQVAIKKMDKRRRLYYNFYTDSVWGDLKYYDLSLNSSSFSMEQIIEILKSVYETIS